MVVAVALLAPALALAACYAAAPAEQAGEAINDAAKRAGDAVNDAADDVKRAGDRATEEQERRRNTDGPAR
ncbi:MAG: hypothetical protein EXQ97_01710 [Alphaproteobacteria bacterium]|nr:hypothetical protein [Alphaproteobacteria bacterium]